MDAGDIAFAIICANLVLLMTPDLVFFYGGLGRRRNVINTVMVCVIPIAVISVMWMVCGHSLSLGGDRNLIGNLSYLFFNGANETASTRGLEVPDALSATSQTVLPIVIVTILTGAAAGYMHFTPLIIFIIFRFLLVYFPFACMIRDEGPLTQWGTIDFAGGDVVHITSGISGLVLTLVLERRRDYNRLEHRPYNVSFIFFDVGLLWFGWSGFNADLTLVADGLTIHASVTTHISTAATMLSWLLVEEVLTGKFSFVGASIGLVIGLVAVTPGAGFVSIWSSLFIGLCVSPVRYFVISILKSKFDCGDALGTFGYYGVGGIFGGLVTGLLTTPRPALDGNSIDLIYGNAYLFLIAVATVVFAIVWLAVATFVIIRVISVFIDIHVKNRAKVIGLDNSEHEETVYLIFMGPDS